MKSAGASTFSRPWLTVLLALGLLTGCERTAAQDEADAKRRADRQAPSAQRLWESANPDYKQPSTSPRECLNRQVFDVRSDMEWGVIHSGGFDGAYAGFTRPVSEREKRELEEDSVARSNGRGIERVQGRVSTQDITNDAPSQVFIDGVKINVFGPNFWPNLVTKTPSNPDKLLMKELSDKLAKQKKLTVAHLNEELIRVTEHLIRGKKEKDIEWITQAGQEIKDINFEKSRVEKLFNNLELGIPESYGYMRETAGGLNRGELSKSEQTYDAILNRNNQVFYFNYKATGDDAKDPAASRKKFVDIVRAFRPRKLFDIPNERGVCFPYGFIADDGTRKANMEVALRFADVPSVLYSVSAGWVDPERGSEATQFTALSRSSVGLLGSLTDAEIKQKLVKRIGNKGAMLGLLEANRGGIELNLAKSGEEPMWSYNLFTGYGGYANSQVLPYFIVDMRSFTKLHVPGLTNNPPPFEESLTRLERMLLSTRLRPTEPLMPELLKQPRPKLD
jgi:hypothetical protein